MGELDAFSAGDLRRALRELEGTGRLVVDVSEVPFMDSAGLGALIGGVRRVRDGDRAVAVACERPTLLRLLRTVGIDRIVPLASSADEAAALLGKEEAGMVGAQRR